MTAVPANHCPGSVMLLFERLEEGQGAGVARRILYTGDFRFHQFAPVAPAQCSPLTQGLTTPLVTLLRLSWQVSTTDLGDLFPWTSCTWTQPSAAHSTRHFQPGRKLKRKFGAFARSGLPREVQHETYSVKRIPPLLWDPLRSFSFFL